MHVKDVYSSSWRCYALWQALSLPDCQSVLFRAQRPGHALAARRAAPAFGSQKAPSSVNMPEAAEVSQAEALKAEGNALFKQKEYLKARVRQGENGRESEHADIGY